LPLLSLLLDALLFINSLIQKLFTLIREFMCKPLCILDALLNLGPSSFPGGIPFCQITVPGLPEEIFKMLRELQRSLNFSLILQNFKSSQFSSGLIPKLRSASSGWALTTQTSCDCPNDIISNALKSSAGTDSLADF